MKPNIELVAVQFARVNETSVGTCSWHYNDEQWKVTLAGPFGCSYGHGTDAFEALERAREAVEQQGWRIGLNGCRLDAWPSGMARDMGQGLRVYVFPEQGPLNTQHIVDTFAPASLALVGDVATQRRLMQERLAAR